MHFSCTNLASPSVQDDTVFMHFGDAIVRELLWLSSNMYDILNRCQTHHLIVGVLLQESFGPVFSSSDRNYGRLKSLCFFEGYPTVYT
jgi:hypothetical protein